MSNTKTVMSQAANTLTTPLNVEDVFSTYLYTGDMAGSRDIVTGIDAATEGGMVWIKNRTTFPSSSGFSQNWVFDTERTSRYALKTNSTDAEAFLSNFKSINTDGFTVGDELNYGVHPTYGGPVDFASWTFRKAPKFFDVVTYTGNGTSGREIAHNLGVAPAAIIVKNLSRTQSWGVYHKDLTSGHYLILNDTYAELNNSQVFTTTAPTSTGFYVGNEFVSNGNNDEYVAYLFAHNDGDGEFGADGDADIIKCGSYTGDGTTNGTNTVELGFEPQWILTKRSDSADNWHICDVMRGQTADGITQRLRANTSAAESGNYGAVPTSTGFKLYSDNSSGGTYIYIAIRRGTKVPEGGTEVFAIDTRSQGTAGPNSVSGFPVDMAIEQFTTGSAAEVFSRLTQGKYMTTLYPDAEGSSSRAQFDFQDGWSDTVAVNSTAYNWMWKRAPNFFDVVAYTGNGVRGRTISHNLGVVPEMMWIKNRDDSQNWLVYVHSLGGTKKLYLNSLTSTLVASIDDFNNTDAEATQFTVGNDGRCNANNQDFVAYLFASLDGVSKVGSYTGNGTSQTIDCGFTSGARFVLIKRTDTSDNWHVWDTERGIVAGNDPYLLLDSTQAEVTSTDNIDPDNSGFIVSGSMNVSSGEYIFYAIA